MAILNSSVFLELGACMNPADNDATMDVCGDGITSCRFLFKIDLPLETFSIERACNGKFLSFFNHFNTDLDADQPNDEKLKIDQSKSVKCMDQLCNGDKYDLGSSMTITISVFAFLLSLLL